MPKLAIAVLVLLPLVWGRSQHSKAWDDAWAQCEAEATEQMETAGLVHDRSVTTSCLVRPAPARRAFMSRNLAFACTR